MLMQEVFSRNTDKQAAEGNASIRLVILQPFVITEQLKEDISKMGQTKVCCDLKCKSQQVLCATLWYSPMFYSVVWQSLHINGAKTYL